MRKILFAAVLFVAALGQAQTTKLPQPDMKRQTLSVMETFKQRHSDRTFSNIDLPQQVLADLLWAAQGVNREDGKLTMPSCMNWQEIRLYVFTKDGVSLYDPKGHSLTEVARGDQRKLVAGRQDFVLQAPVCLVLVVDLEKNGHTDARSREMATVDAGICTQNICIFCAAAGLSTVPRASMEHEKISQLLNLTENQIPMMNCPVGYPAK